MEDIYGALNPAIPGLLSPGGLGLMQAGLGMMAASGPSRTPTSFGQIMGQGGMQGLQAYQQALQAEEQRKMRLMQMMEQKRMHEAQRARWEAETEKDRLETELKRKKDEYWRTAPSKFMKAGTPAEYSEDAAGIHTHKEATAPTLDIQGLLADAASRNYADPIDYYKALSQGTKPRSLQQWRDGRNLVSGFYDPSNPRANPQGLVEVSRGPVDKPAQVHVTNPGPLVPIMDPKSSTGWKYGTRDDAKGTPAPTPGFVGAEDRATKERGMKLRKEYDTDPMVRSANELEARIPQIAQYIVSKESNPVNDAVLSKLWLSITQGDKKLTNMDAMQIAKLPGLPERVRNMFVGFLSGKSLDEPTKSDMWKTVSNHYKELDAYRTKKKSETIKRGKDMWVSEKYIFGKEDE